ncbi:ATP-binding protein [Alkalicoccobacillus gibsonii]|uniref:ATP-binding protein n=1 Tax=Alkalicoccobacillus gibsonii TaxID=79881 RepID=UPI003F7B5A48
MQVISGKIEKKKKVVLYGPEGIGKSSIASQFPKPLFIDTEGSTTELTIDRLQKPSSWTMLYQQIDWAMTQVGVYETLVIDTIDWAEMFCIEAICSQHNKKGIEDFGYGNGYVYVKEEFGRFLNKLSDVIDAGLNVVLTAHAQIRKFEQPDEIGAYDRYELKLGKKTSSQTAPLVKEWADMLLFMNYKTYSVSTDDKAKKNKAQGGVRTFFATHHPAWDAKNRHGLPDEFPMDYSHIAHIFQSNNQAPPIQQPDPVQQKLSPNVPPSNATPSPTVEQQQPPQQVTEPSVQNEEPNQLDPSIKPALRDLMQQAGVSEEEIQIVVSNKGYYPIDTPIVNYDPSFVDGVLIAAWQQVYKMIEEFRANISFK